MFGCGYFIGVSRVFVDNFGDNSLCDVFQVTVEFCDALFVFGPKCLVEKTHRDSGHDSATALTSVAIGLDIVATKRGRKHLLGPTIAHGELEFERWIALFELPETLNNTARASEAASRSASVLAPTRSASMSRSFL